jgi:hypothetical protein
MYVWLTQRELIDEYDHVHIGVVASSKRVIEAELAELKARVHSQPHVVDTSDEGERISDSDTSAQAAEVQAMKDKQVELEHALQVAREEVDSIQREGQAARGGLFTFFFFFCGLSK